MKGKKKPNEVQLLLRMVVRDPDGKVLSDTGQKPSKSFVLQFLMFIYALFNAPGNVAAKQVTGASNWIYMNAQVISNLFKAAAPINSSVYGIVVGTGDTAETNIDFKLDVQLTEGVGLGNITHDAVIIGDTAVVGANVDLVLIRSFPNSTGLTITIKEAGLYVRNTLAPGYTHCIIRDVLGTPIDVPDMCALTVYYTLRTTV